VKLYLYDLNSSNGLEVLNLSLSVHIACPWSHYTWVYHLECRTCTKTEVNNKRHQGLHRQ